MSNRPDRFCRYEGEEFPASEFTRDPEWGLVHEVEPRHTMFGDDIDGDDWVLLIPGTPPPMTSGEKIFLVLALALIAVAVVAIIYFAAMA